MARNKYSAPGKSHERQLSRKERKKLRDEMLELEKILKEKKK